MKMTSFIDSWPVFRPTPDRGIPSSDGMQRTTGAAT
jgi:hypothetical protein